MQPCYKYWEIPYYWLGLKVSGHSFRAAWQDLVHRALTHMLMQAYDAVAGTQGLTMSRFTSASESRRQFPTLAESGPNARALKGTVHSQSSAAYTQACACNEDGVCHFAMRASTRQMLLLWSHASRHCLQVSADGAVPAADRVL